MNCLEFEKIVVDLVSGDKRLMEASRQQDGLKHAQNCPRCAARWQNEKSLQQAFRTIAQGDEHLGASVALENNLLVAFRAKQAVAPEVAAAANVITFPSKPRLTWTKWAVAAAAAVLLIVFGLARVLQPQEPVKQVNHEVVNYTPTPAPTVKNETPAPTPNLPEAPQQILTVKNVNNLSGKPKPVKRNFAPNPSHKLDRVTVDVGPFEVAEPEEISAKDFMVFDYAETMPPPERSQIMRVKFPRERLAPLGIPITPQMRNRDFINTDLLVGSDGVPRAIRVVNR